MEVSLDHLGREPIGGREAGLEACAAYIGSNPLWKGEIIDLSTKVNEQAGTAKVWMHLRATGFPRKIQQEQISLINWRREKDTWVVLRQHGIRGLDGE